MKRIWLKNFAAAVCVSMVFGMTGCSAAAKADNVNAVKDAAQTDVSDNQKSEAALSKKNGLDNVAAASGKADVIEIESEPDGICGADESTWSPFTDCNSLEEAKEAAGIDISVPEKIEGYDMITYAAMKRYKLVQVEYSKDENRYICIRKAEAKEDISGDYNNYSEETVFEKNGIQVKLKGNDKNVSLAVWTDGAYSYSIMYAGFTEKSTDSGSGISAEQMKALVLQVK